jgi:HD-like signal output (HDOD) protein
MDEQNVAAGIQPQSPQHAEPRSILVIDSHHALSAAVTKAAHLMPGRWSVVTAADPHAIADLMALHATDVVVCGIEPLTAALGLLGLVQRRHPEALRLVAVRSVDVRHALESSNVAHQCLDRAAAPEHIAFEIARVIALQARIGNPHVRRFVGGLPRIPSMPSIYRRLKNIVSSPDYSLRDVTQAIVGDAGVAARVLRLVNSAYFGLRKPVTSLDRAVNLLGASTVSSLVFGLKVSDQFDTSGPAGRLITTEWERSLAVASGAGSIARGMGSAADIVDRAYLGGLFHNVGRMVLADNIGSRYAAVAWPVSRAAIAARERVRFKVGHPEVAAILLASWGLDDDLVDTVAFAGDPSASVTSCLSPLVAVHAASVFESGGDQVDAAFLDRCGLADEVERLQALWLRSSEDRLAG